MGQAGAAGAVVRGENNVYDMTSAANVGDGSRCHEDLIQLSVKA